MPTALCAAQLVQGHLQEVQGLLGEPQEVTVASLEGAGPLTDWKDVFRITQVSQPFKQNKKTGLLGLHLGFIFRVYI